MLWIGQGQWENGKGVFSSDTQGLPTRHQELETRTGSEHFRQARCCLHHLLEVIQHKQQVLFTQRRFQQFQWRSGATFLQAECLRDGGQDQVGIPNGGERDEAGPIGEVLLHFSRDCQRQARFAYPSGAGQGEQADLWA